MKRVLLTAVIGLLGIMTAGCAAKEEQITVSLFDRARVVGADIRTEDITDFYYTEENINYDAYYQRYRFYTEDGRYLFFHETRERPGDYGPCTEADTTLTGTLELTEEQWSRFLELVQGGNVRARGESADSGGTGPWLYLYWTEDKGKYQEFSFASYGAEKAFTDFCLSLIPAAD